MEPAETSEDEHEGKVLAWLNVLTDAVDILLRQSERELDREAKQAFAAGDASTVLLRQAERDQARSLRADLRSLRARYANHRTNNPPFLSATIADTLTGWE